MGALSNYLEKKWGVKTRSLENPVTDTAGAGVTKILLNNPDRFEAIIVNYDSVLMRVAPSLNVSATFGIPLDPNGGFTIITADYDGEMVGYEWFIYSASGGTFYVLITEAS
jgi:hypothetical protein